MCFAAQRLARRLARAFDDALRPVGLTNGQFSLMMSLNRPSPPTVSQVAEELCMDRTTVTAMLKVLKGRGLVEDLSDPSDRRSRRLRLTEAGRGVLAAALPVWQASHDRLEARLGRHRAASLRSALADPD